MRWKTRCASWEPQRGDDLMGHFLLEETTGDFDTRFFLARLEDTVFWKMVGWMMTNSWKRMGIGRYVGFYRLSKCISRIRSYKREGHECLSIRDGFISGPSMSLYHTWLMHARNNGHKFNSSWVIFWTMSYFMLIETLNDRSLQVKAITTTPGRKSSLFFHEFHDWTHESHSLLKMIKGFSWLVEPVSQKTQVEAMMCFFRRKHVNVLPH